MCLYTVKAVYKDHPQDPKTVDFIDMWSLHRSSA